jgi:pseudoazurin
MTKVLNRLTLLGLGVLGTIAASAPASAKEVQVKMLNAGAAGTMVFEPAFVKLSPGDTVRFVSVNPGHNAQSLPDMIPAGAQPFQTPISKDGVVKFTAPGLYGYKCMPHYGMGMVGLIQVGAASNKDAVATAAAKLPPRAKARMTAALEQAR